MKYKYSEKQFKYTKQRMTLFFYQIEAVLLILDTRSTCYIINVCFLHTVLNRTQISLISWHRPQETRVCRDGQNVSAVTKVD